MAAKRRFLVKAPFVKIVVENIENISFSVNSIPANREEGVRYVSFFLKTGENTRVAMYDHRRTTIAAFQSVGKKVTPAGCKKIVEAFCSMAKLVISKGQTTWSKDVINLYEAELPIGLNPEDVVPKISFGASQRTPDGDILWSREGDEAVVSVAKA